MFCVDTGERGFPGLQGQKGDRGQSLHVILAVADITPAKMSKILRKMLHLNKVFLSSGEFRYARRKRETGF